MKHGPPPSLKNTTDIDFGRDTWIKFYLKDYSLFHCVYPLQATVQCTTRDY